MVLFQEVDEGTVPQDQHLSRLDAYETEAKISSFSMHGVAVGIKLDPAAPALKALICHGYACPQALVSNIEEP